MSGDYECRASNSVGEGVQKLLLVVQYAPQITLKVCDKVFMAIGVIEEK